MFNKINIHRYISTCYDFKGEILNIKNKFAENITDISK